MESHEELVELIKPYLPVLEEEFEVSPEELSDDEFELWESTAHRTTFIDTTDRNNWKRATDWLHDHLTIYLNVLSQPPTQ